jgi:tetratricopeptide (TPR) repeat protein
LSILGTSLAEQNDLEDARKSYESALNIRLQLGDKSGEANSLSAIANLQLMQRDLAGAVEGYEKVLELAREIGSQRQEALTLHNLALAEKDEGHLARAEQHFQQLLPTAERLGDKGLIVGCLLNLATISAAEGDMPGAKRLAQKSLDIRRQDKSKPRLGGVLSEFADLELLAGELTEAEKLYSESLQIFKTLGHDYRISYPLFGIGDIMLARGDVSGARKHHDEALLLRIQEHGAVKDLFDSRVHTAQVSLEEGRADEAEAGIRLAFNEYAAHDEPDARVSADAVLIQSLIAQKKLLDAQKILAEDRLPIVRGESRFDRIMMDLSLARVETASAQNAAAITLLQTIVKQARQSGYKSLEFEARLALGEAESISVDRVAGRRNLRALEQEARAAGFLLIARKSSAARISERHS